MGGSQVLDAFLQVGELDRLELFVIPLLLGGGVPLWRGGQAPRQFELRRADKLAAGVVRLDCALPEPKAGRTE